MLCSYTVLSILSQSFASFPLCSFHSRVAHFLYFGLFPLFFISFIFGGERIEVPVGLPLIRDVQILLENTDPTEKGREAQGVLVFFFCHLKPLQNFFSEAFSESQAKGVSETPRPSSVLIMKG